MTVSFAFFPGHSLQVKKVAGQAFDELVHRAAACDRIRGVLALLKRYENLFRLPTRIRQASERGLYDQARTPPTHRRPFLRQDMLAMIGCVGVLLLPFTCCPKCFEVVKICHTQAPWSCRKVTYPGSVMM